jgi:hypothetical protein
LDHPFRAQDKGAPAPGGDGGSPLYPDQPPALSGTPTPGAPGAPGTPGTGPINPNAMGIPATVLAAYQRAADRVNAQTPGGHLRWQMLAGIGRVESEHAEGGDVDANGTTRHPILGPQLDGTGGTEAVANAYGSRWDQAGHWARAVGPMQFLPSTWSRWGVDGNGDGVADPENVFDATLAAGDYLVADGRDLATAQGLRAAILAYNHSEQYYETVLRWIDAYSAAGIPVPDGQPVPPPHPGQGQGNGPKPPRGPVPPTHPPQNPPSTPPGTPTPPATPPQQPPATPPQIPPQNPPQNGPCPPDGTPSGSPPATPGATPPGGPTPSCPPATPPATPPQQPPSTPTSTPTSTPPVATATPTASPTAQPTHNAPTRPTATPTVTPTPTTSPSASPSPSASATRTG